MYEMPMQSYSRTPNTNGPPNWNASNRCVNHRYRWPKYKQAVYPTDNGLVVWDHHLDSQDSTMCFFWHTLGRVPYSSWVMSARGSGFLLKTSTPVNWSTELYPQWPAEKATEVNIALGQIPSWNPRTVESCQGRGNRSPQPASVYNRVMPFTTASLCPEYLFYCPCREIFPFGKNHQMVSVMLTTVH